MSDGDNRCERGVRGCSGVPEFGASGPRGQSLPLETALLALHQLREVTPRRASCSLVKPEVTSPTSPTADFSSKGEKRGRRAVHGALHNWPRSPPQPSEGRRQWPLSRALVRTPHAHPDLPHALPPQTAQLRDAGHSRSRPPAPLSGLQRPPAPPPEATSLLLPTPPGGGFRPRVRACAPAAASATVAARGSVCRATWCCLRGVKVLSDSGLRSLPSLFEARGGRWRPSPGR